MNIRNKNKLTLGCFLICEAVVCLVVLFVFDEACEAVSVHAVYEY